MGIITLTTDLGLRDFYVPSVKGRIYTHSPETKVVDITHQIKPFNIAEAAFLLSNAYRDFPEFTTHLVSIESDFDTQGDFVLAQVNNHYFIAKNNGLISLITDEPTQKIRKLTESDRSLLKFPLKEVMADIAIELDHGTLLDELGEPMDEMVARANLRPILLEGVIRGTVIYVDNFGNAISNITKQTLERYSEKKQISINYNKTNYIKAIQEHYEDVPEGECIALFGVNGYLEIAINKGNASQLLGLHIGHTIIVECE